MARAPKLCILSALESVRINRGPPSEIHEFFRPLRAAQVAAPDHQRAVKMIRPTTPEIFLYGYYGAGNLGDALLLSATIAGITARWPSAAFRVRNLGTQEVDGQFGNRVITADIERILWRSDLPRAIRACIYLGRAARAMRGCRCFVLGGGTLIQAKRSLGSLALLTALIIIARVLGLKVIGLGLGTAHLESLPARILARLSVALMVDVAVRDEASRRELGGFDKARLCADLVYDWWPHDLDRVAENGPPVLAVSLWSVSPEYETRITAALVQTLQACSRDGWRIRFLVFQDGDPAQGGLTDRIAIETLGSSLADRGVPFEVVRPENSPARLAAAFANVKIHCGARFHGGVIASLLGIPTVGLATEPKVTSLCAALRMPALDPERITSDQLTEAINSARTMRVDARVIASLRASAARNFEWFDGLQSGK